MNITRTVIMPNYKQGKIYKIVSNTDDDICYVGSTTQPLLCQRMVEHRSGYGRWKNGGKCDKTSSYDMFDKYGVSNCRIELIEIFPCNSKDELTKKEGEYIRSLECVNKKIAGRTKQGWYNDNRDICLEKNREYNYANRDAILEYKKGYCEANKNIIVEYKKKWFRANKDTVYEKAKEKYTCCCGSTLRKGGKYKHEKSQKHKDYCTSVASPCSIVKCVQ